MVVLCHLPTQHWRGMLCILFNSPLFRAIICISCHRSIKKISNYTLCDAVRCLFALFVRQISAEIERRNADEGDWLRALEHFCCLPTMSYRTLVPLRRRRRQ